MLLFLDIQIFFNCKKIDQIIFNVAELDPTHYASGTVYIVTCVSEVKDGTQILPLNHENTCICDQILENHPYGHAENFEFTKVLMKPKTHFRYFCNYSQNSQHF